MYKKVADAQYRSKLSNELMMYHMKVGVSLSTSQDMKYLIYEEHEKLHQLEFQYTGGLFKAPEYL